MKKTRRRKASDDGGGGGGGGDGKDDANGDIVLTIFTGHGHATHTHSLIECDRFSLLC